MMGLIAALPITGARAADVSRLVFIPSTDTPTVTAIDTSTDTIVRRIAVAAPPHQLAISASLSLLLTANPDEKAISVVDLNTDTPAEAIAVDMSPEHIQLDPNGRTLAVGNYEGGAILLVDLGAKRVTARIDGFRGPHHLAFAPDGRTLYVGNLNADTVSIVDVASALVTKEIEVTAPPAADDAPALGGVRAITIGRDGRQAFVTFGNDEGLAVLDLSDQRPAKRLPLGQLSRRAFVTADGRRLLVPNDGDDSISIIDTLAVQEIARLPGGRVMTGIVTAWFETTAFVLARSERQAMVLDLTRNERVGQIALSGQPAGGAATADGSKVYVALGDRDSVAVIDARSRRLATVINGVGRHPWGASVVSSVNFCH